MKTLTLLRHAKSGWDDPAMRDFDRPLNPRGRRAARAVGGEMRAQGLGFDRVVASPARRVVETLEDVSAGYGAPLSPAYDDRIYLAATATLLQIVRETDDSVAALLLAGHNPGMETLALLLARPGADSFRGEIELKYPTGSVAEISLPAGLWSDVCEASGAISRFIRPRDLDPELGPDNYS